jgi:hypothetical protein
MGDELRELREGGAEIGDQRLRYVEGGNGPLMVLLHGFPEFWYGWRQQVRPLAAAAGFRVVVPDTVRLQRVVDAGWCGRLLQGPAVCRY